MKSTLFAFALALTFTSSAFAAPVKATDEQLSVLKRATRERLSAIADRINTSTSENKDLDLPNCQLKEEIAAIYGRASFDADKVNGSIAYSHEAWIDEGAQPVLTFVVNPLASRAGESSTVVRIVSNASNSNIISVSLETTNYKEVLGGSVSNPSYSVQGMKEVKSCELRTALKPAQPAPAQVKKSTKAAILK